jgi:large subunit ribosomal protein L22
VSAADRKGAPEGGWESLTVDELGEELEARGLKKSGKKDELVARLEEFEAELGEAESRQTPDASRQEEEGADEEEGPPEEGLARRRSAETMTAPRKAAPRRDDGQVVISASARYVRSAPRKARLVMGHIRGKQVVQAQAILSHAPRAVATDIRKLLESALANAENNYELAPDELRIARAYVDEGPTIKRYRPRALGRATRINKRTSHMTIELTTGER